MWITEDILPKCFICRAHDKVKVLFGSIMTPTQYYHCSQGFSTMDLRQILYMVSNLECWGMSISIYHFDKPQPLSAELQRQVSGKDLLPSAGPEWNDNALKCPKSFNLMYWYFIFQWRCTLYTCTRYMCASPIRNRYPHYVKIPLHCLDPSPFLPHALCWMPGDIHNASSLSVTLNLRKWMCL